MNAPEATIFTQLQASVGQELGVTDWFTVSQRDADLYSALIDDWDVMHNDPVWATPRFGGTIAHGLYVVSLFPKFIKEIDSPIPVIATPTASTLNYGFDRIRFVSPLRIGQRARDRVVLTEVTEKKPGDFLVRTTHTIEKEDDPTPHIVADWLAYVVTDYSDKWVAQ